MSPMKQSKKRILKTIVATALIGSPVFAGDLQVARMIAQGDLEAAGKHPRVQSDSSWKRIVRDVAKAYQRAEFLEASPGKTWRGCAENEVVLAYVQRGDKKVYMCPLAMSKESDFISQVLLHEATHVSGNYDECSTSEVEFSLRALAGRRPFKNGYADRCGLSGRFDFQGGSSTDWGVDSILGSPSDTDWSTGSARSGGNQSGGKPSDW